MMAANHLTSAELSLQGPISVALGKINQMPSPETRALRKVKSASIQREEYKLSSILSEEY